MSPTREQKRLARFDIGSLAVVAERGFLHDEFTPGVAFARAVRQQNRTGKDNARSMVLNMLNTAKFPRLRVLTMPGYWWKFERSLLSTREGCDWKQLERVKNTFITSVECDELVYRSSFARMPGFQREVEVLPPNIHSTAGIKTPLISAYHCGLFEDFGAATRQHFDFVWADFNGPVTATRLRVLSRLWRVCIRSGLVVTQLKARQDAGCVREIKKAGSIAHWMSNAIGVELPSHQVEYADGGAPMLQLGWFK